MIIAAIGMAPDTAAFAGQVGTNAGRDASGRRADAPERRALALRRRRRRLRRLRHHPGDRPGPARRLHDRPLDPGPDPRRASTSACRSSTRTPSSPDRRPTGWPCRPAPSEVDQRRADRLPRGRAADDRGRGALRRRAVPRLRRLLGVRRVRRRLPGRRLHRPARPRPGHGRRGRRGRGRHRLQAVRRRPQAAVRLRHLQERHHRHADGPPARPDPAVQHDPPARATARSPSGSPT